MEERVILVSEQDQELGNAEKLQAHKEKELHRSFSIFIFNPQGEMLLQRRAEGKYHSGGLWTNTCCGHPRPGEETKEAASRRLKEEMGFVCEIQEQFQFMYKVKLDHGLWEHEFDHVFFGTYEGEPNPASEEVSEYRWVKPNVLLGHVQEHPEQYTEWFKIALPRGEGIVKKFLSR
jgi:isopentenyl-diphosphate delta-isomerase